MSFARWLARRAGVRFRRVRAMATDPANPNPRQYRCERCGVTETVCYDYTLKAWLCALCWARTPVPGPKKPRDEER